MFHMPMSSPMITTMLGRCPAGVGCCCACAGVAKPAPDSAEAANNELPLNSKSRRFSAPPLCVMPSSDFPFTWSLLMTHSFSDDAPETDMACRGVDRLGMARGGTIAAAIVRCAQMRAAFKHFAWNFDVWLTRVVARGLGPAARIRRNAARLRGIGIVRLRIPISRPLPDIADHVVQAVAVSWECGDRGCALEAVRAKILAREFALPGIRHMLALRHELIAPGKLGAVKPTACGEFPFGLGRQVLAGPFGVSERVDERHMHDRMIVEPIDIALRAIGVAPVGALEEGPPFTPIA